MKLDGIGSGGSPLADFLRSRVERILAAFQAGVTPVGDTPDRGAVERFLLALDDLAAATDGLGTAAPAPAGPAERTAAPVLVAGDERFAAEVRQGAGRDREVVAVGAGDASIRGVLERKPALVAASGARGAEAIRRIHEIRPGLPALLAAAAAEAAALAEAFKDEPVVVLRDPQAKEVALATRALLLADESAAAPAAEAAAKDVPEIEPRSYAHLAGLLPRALERTVAFDVGAAVIARPVAEPLVDIFAKSDCPEATLALVRARAVALYRRVAGGVESSTADEGGAADSTLRSSMYFPLATEGAVVGLTYLAAFRPDAFSPADEQVLAALARNASGAYRRLEASVHRLRLSPRQSQVLALIASGLSDKEVASRLGLAHRTVRTHVDRMLREHGLRSRTEAVAAWLRGRQG
jgi:DNA-binding CsgD family transcriptional regulator